MTRIAKLIPVLETMHARDQHRLGAVMHEIHAIEEERNQLNSPAVPSMQHTIELGDLNRLEKYQLWKNEQIVALSERISALEPEAQQARAALAISFGKLLVARKLLADAKPR